MLPLWKFFLCNICIYAVLIAIFPTQCFASPNIKEAPTPDNPVRLQLKVSATDLRRVQMYRCLEEQLGGLDGVEIVGEKPDRILDVILAKGKSRGGFPQDVVVSAVGLKYSHSGAYIMDWHQVFVGYPNFERGCHDVAITYAESRLKIDTRGKIKRFP